MNPTKQEIKKLNKYPKKNITEKQNKKSKMSARE